MDAFMYGQEPLYSSETAASTVNELVGSVAAVTFSTKEDVEMVPHEQKAAKETLDSDDTNSGLHPRKTSHYHKIMNRVKHMSLKKTRRNAVVYFKESEVPSTTAQPSFIVTPPPLQRSQSVPANSARICLPRLSLPASLSFGMVNEVDKGCLLSSLRFETLNEVDEVDEEDEDSQQPVAI
ncbi:unnamed protein product [Anisakis simplex]|uniref:Uncharacterized protein n=1 Tax=Anisakis simplex TaxID=6269 RepID=A0A0M3KC73_ANISI|nr:unnamed protein product [Anisakis simplex]